MKLTAKQEMFAREIAKGTNQYQSFIIAYPLQGRNSTRETLDSNASRLASNSKVLTRVEQLQKKALTHVKYDIEAHFKELEELRKLSLVPMGKDGNIDVKAGIKATELKGKVKGHYVTQTITTNTNLELTNEEAESKLRDFAEKLGLTYEEYKERMGIT